MEKELIKLLVDQCFGVRFLKYTNFGRYITDKNRDEISDEELMELILSAPKEAFEEAYYDFIDKNFDQNDEIIDDLVLPGGIMDFENIVGETGKTVGEEGWVRIKTDVGFRVVFAKFVKLPMSNYVLKKYRLNRKADDLVSIERNLAKLRDLRINQKLYSIITKSGLRPTMAKIQKSKNRYEYIPANLCELVGDDIVERIQSDTKADFVSTKTIYKKDTDNQVHYMRQRGLSKPVAEVLANLEGTSIDYNLEKAFKSLQ